MKSGFVAIIGLPNVGKSSLMNALVGEAVSIVTSKPQTTRKRTLGISSKKDEHQIVFVDTPGFIEDRKGLNTFLREEFEEALKDVDVVIATVGPWEFREQKKPWALSLMENVTSARTIYVLTQGDRYKGEEIDLLLKRWKEWSNAELLVSSAKDGHGVKNLESQVVELLEAGPEYYDPEIYTNQTLREVSSEVVRKSCFENLHQEVPYGLAVRVSDFQEGSIYKIHADIIVERESHKSMVIGQKGQKLKSIGTQSRIELEKVFGQKVFLKLHVIAKPQWTQNKSILEELGYAH